MKIVVTGAAGFVGRPLCAMLTAQGHEVTALVRREAPLAPPAAHVMAVGDLSEGADWAAILSGAECVVHLAARTHSADRPGKETDALYERANVVATEHLVRGAKACGVRRLVFVSSIKVNGEKTRGVPFRADYKPAPEDAYGRSKARAESRVREIAGDDLDVVVLRPPLMYGPGVGGNVAQLFRWAARGIPLPIGSIANRRDILGVTNFVDLIGNAISNPAAAGRTLLVRDGTPVSTPGLYAAISAALGRRARMLPCPVGLLMAAGGLVGRADTVRKLVGDLEIDDEPTRRELGWTPPVDMQDELFATAQAFRSA